MLVDFNQLDTYCKPKDFLGAFLVLKHMLLWTFWPVVLGLMRRLFGNGCGMLFMLLLTLFMTWYVLAIVGCLVFMLYVHSVCLMHVFTIIQ